MTEALTVRPAPLPAARIGRVSRGAGGAIALLWAWLRLPRVERFRRCSRCRYVLDTDHARSGLGTGVTVCCGIMEPSSAGGRRWCLHLTTRLG